MKEERYLIYYIFERIHQRVYYEAYKTSLQKLPYYYQNKKT